MSAIAPGGPFIRPPNKYRSSSATLVPTCTTWSQNCCGRSSMMPNESAREKTARREATVDRQKGFWMVGRADFFGADRWFFGWAPRRAFCWTFHLCQCICRQGAEALEHESGRFLGGVFELGACAGPYSRKRPQSAHGGEGLQGGRGIKRTGWKAASTGG